MAPSTRVHTAPLPLPIPLSHPLPLRGGSGATSTTTPPPIRSRNDLFYTSWSPDVRPAPPLASELWRTSSPSPKHSPSPAPAPPLIGRGDMSYSHNKERQRQPAAAPAPGAQTNASGSESHARAHTQSLVHGHASSLSLSQSQSHHAQSHSQVQSQALLQSLAPGSSAPSRSPSMNTISGSPVPHHGPSPSNPSPTGPGLNPSPTSTLRFPSLDSTFSSSPSSRYCSASSTSPRLHPATHSPLHTLSHLAVPRQSATPVTPATPPTPSFLGSHTLVASPTASPASPTGPSAFGTPGSKSPTFEYTPYNSNYGARTPSPTEAQVPRAFGNMNMTNVPSNTNGNTMTVSGIQSGGKPSPPSTSKTSNFFASAAADTPPPAPRLGGLAPSPLSLSRASSLRARALPARTSAPSPPPLTPDEDGDIDCDSELPISPRAHRRGHLHPGTGPPDLSPLHQSPNLVSAKAVALSTLNLPRPPAADHIALRVYPDETYLLGEGRHACVYLAAYKRVGQSGESTRPGHALKIPAPAPAPSANAEGAEWTLCAAKRLAPDRESQTLGLREAFFLNRLAGLGRRKSSRSGSPRGRDLSRGRVYVVKLIAVKDEDAPAPRVATHTRSASDSADGTPSGSGAGTPVRGVPSVVATPSGSPLRRPRSSTIFASGRQEPSQPSPVESARLILVLEHAPLGTLDRIIRTSPGLVGEQLWGRWAREASEALEWVHSRGVVHADVKPSNLLLTADLHLRLSDFGSSLLIHPAHPPTDGVGLGTLPFSPPELVDPTAPFSFPVDIFALGATLYQCISGREPYRGSRPVEMMLHVRNGGLWAWEERERLGRIGTGANTPAASGSPYPSEAISIPMPADPLRRAGSLRVPSSTWGPESHKLHRVGSAESLQAADDVVGSATESPAGVKLWHHWIKAGRGRGDPVDRLLRADDDPLSPLLPTSPTFSASPTAPVSRSSSLRHGHGHGHNRTVSRSSSLRSAIHSHSPTSPTMPWPTLRAPQSPQRGALYADGAPAMYFLADGRVPDDVRDVLHAMLEAAPEARPTASELVSAWETLGVGRDEGEGEGEGGDGVEGGEGV